MHNRVPERKIFVRSVDEVLRIQEKFRVPLFAVARKQKYFWSIREKFFND
nr:hypothetical protein BdHM001_02830 [Bdellovibrio sp. HM001]